MTKITTVERFVLQWKTCGHANKPNSRHTHELRVENTYRYSVFDDPWVRGLLGGDGVLALRAPAPSNGETGDVDTMLWLCRV